MADQYTWEIVCVNKDPRFDPYHAITHVGLNTSSGVQRISLDQAINGIENRGWRLYSSVNGKSVWVVVAMSRNGNKYLKTEADGAEPNNLLSLPECRV